MTRLLIAAAVAAVYAAAGLAAVAVRVETLDVGDAL